MADVSKVKINNTLYDVKDATARTDLATKAPLASPSLTGTPTAPTASSGTNTTQIATTAFAKGEADMKLSKTGDTMTGALFLKSSAIDETTTPASDTYGTSLILRDVNDKTLGSAQVSQLQADGAISMNLYAQRTVSGSPDFNMLRLQILPDGTKKVAVTDAGAWRTALGLGDSGWLTATNAAKFSGTVYYRKIGNLVQVNAYDITLASGLSASGNVNIGALIPSGYRPSKVTTFPIRWHSDSKTSSGLLNGSGEVFINAPDTSAVTTSSTLCFTATYFIA